MNGTAGATRLGRAATNVGVGLAALLLAGLGLELACRLGVRVGWLRPSLRGKVAPDLPYAARLVRSEDEALHVEWDPTDPLLNRTGLRGPVVPQKKPPHTFRMLVLGDSVTYGLGVPNEDTFVARLGERLAAAAAPWVRR